MGGDPARVGTIPFVGRERELADIVEQIASGAAGAYVIAGPPGAGKSRLAVEVAAELAKTGFDTVRILATRAVRSIPFGAVAPLLPELSNTGDRLGLLRQATTEILKPRAARRLLVFEDAQLLDDGSAALLLQLVQAGGCAVLITLRTPADAPDPVGELWKDQLAERLDLAPLGAAEVEAMASAALDGPVAAATVRWLADKSAGNPMFVRELLIGAANHDALVRQDGLWLVRLPFPAPERLAELVAMRLGTLSSAAMDVVDLLAIGEPLPFALLETLAGRDAVEEAEQSGVIELREASANAEAGLSHPLYAEVRRQRMPHARLRRLSGMLVEQFDRSATPSGDELLRLARWQLDAGGPGDVDVLTQAAAHARVLFDIDLAVKLGHAALASGGGAAAGLALAEAYFYSGRLDEAEATLAEAAGNSDSETDLARIVHARAYNLGMLKGDQAAAEAVVADALVRLTEPDALRRLTVTRLMLRLWSGQVHSVLAEALEVAGWDDPHLASRGTSYGAITCALAGRAEQALKLGRQGERLARPLGVDLGPQFIGQVLALRAEGRFADLEQMIDAVYAQDRPDGNIEMRATYELLHGIALIEMGRPGEAARMFRDALAINRELRDTGPLRWCLGGLVLASALTGDERTARPHLIEVDRLPPHSMAAFDDELIERGRAWLKVAGGQLAAARSILLAAADHAAADGRSVAEALLRHDVARLGEPYQVAGRLTELAEEVDGQFVDVLALHARAASAGDTSQLETAANMFEQLGATLLAAEAGADVADRHRRAGDIRQATAWGIHVDQLRRSCGQVHTPGLDAVGSVGVLTPREHEIAALAAGGATTREIAGRLVLSVRTVENHLQRAYSKLGVSGRDQLAMRLPGGIDAS